MRAATCASVVLSGLAVAACGGASDSVVGVEAGNGTVPAEGHVSAIDARGQVLIDHEGFQLRYDCRLRSTVRYVYTLTTDTGNLPRPSAYSVEPLLPTGCPAQTNTASYANVKAGYDRGHLVTANHLDGNAMWLAAANHMSNIVPQVSTFNQGLWLDIENTAECYRDRAPVQVIGGVVYNDATNDHFLVSHGVPTPDLFWKLLVTTDPASGTPRAIAWIVPNAFMLNTLDSYLVSVSELEARIGADEVGAPALPDVTRNVRAAASWALPAGCNFS